MLRDPRPAARWKRHARRVRALTLVATGCGVMVATFQNFEVPSELRVATPLERASNQAIQWSVTRAEAESLAPPTTDIRDLAPKQALPNDHYIATPQSGNDLGSIGQDWATREAHLLTGGADERWINDMNKKISHLWSSDESSTASDGSISTSASNHNVTEESDGLRPKSVRLTALNRVQVDWANSTQLGCAVQGSGVQLDLSHPLNDSLNVNLHHETAGSKSTLNVSYRW